jgi:prolipoprotein diacylglyceryl transferase
MFTRQKRSLSFPAFADALAPGLLFAQGIGRWGNWFNAELFGKPSGLPWALSIPLEKRPIGYENFTTFHPTFLYESLWCFASAIILMRLPWFTRRIGSGQLFLGYVALYTFGRIWIEALRIDAAHIVLGLRINIWVSVIIFLISTIALLRRSRKSR